MEIALHSEKCTGHMRCMLAYSYAYIKNFDLLCGGENKN